MERESEERQPGLLRGALWHGGWLALWFLLLFPQGEYRAWCEAGPRGLIEAPLRTVYANRLAESLDQGGYSYMRRGDDFALPLLWVSQWLRIWPVGHPLDATIMEWRHAAAIAQGFGARGQHGLAVPEAVVRLVRGWEERTGQVLERNSPGDRLAPGQWSEAGLALLPRCALKRAALTVADDFPGPDTRPARRPAGNGRWPAAREKVPAGGVGPRRWAAMGP